jgi:hypothetical protein
MSDEVLTIKLTEREIDLLHQCISTNIETVKRRHDVTGSTADLLQELGELSDDLLEQLHRRDGDSLEGKTFTIAEDDMIQRGMDAREQSKMHSRAADRRNFNMKRRDTRLSKTQTHDVWDDNDPKNW